MKILLLFIISCTYLFSHGIIPQEKKQKSLSYGIFADIIYEHKNLYSSGIPMSFGYKSHTKDKQLAIIHHGAYLNKQFKNYVFNININKHKGSKRNLNNYLEEAYFSYVKNNSYIKLGRSNHNISFLDENLWAKNFIKAPLFLDSYFDDSIYLDGLFFKYNNENLNIYFNHGKHIYSNKKRSSIKFSYDFKNYTFISYFLNTQKTNHFTDFLNTNDGHSHSHSNTAIDCTKLLGTSLCFDEKKQLFALGVKANLQKVKLQTEYIFMEKKAEIYSSSSKVNSKNNLHDIYIQVESKNPSLNYTYRIEAFWYEQEIKGLASDLIVKNIKQETNNINYLNTLGVNYKINKNQKVYLEAQLANDEELSFRTFYKLSFNK